MVRPPPVRRPREWDDVGRQRRVRRILFWILWANLALVAVKVAVGWVIGVEQKLILFIDSALPRLENHLL